MFADDCVLQFSNSNFSNLVETCNNELSLFKDWSDSNRLTINLDKTNCMLVSNVENGLSNHNIRLHDQPVKIIDDAKFLGVRIDCRLKFNLHIDYICSKISKSIGILFRLREVVPKQCLRTIYFTLIHPFIIYCLPIFGATYEVHLHPLNVLHKRAVRLISDAPFLAHADPLFYENNILKIYDQNKHSLATYVYKNIDVLLEYQRLHNYSTRNRENLLPPFHRLRTTQQSVLFNAINVWNSVPQNIKECTSVCGFKNRYKRYLIEHYEH